MAGVLEGVAGKVSVKWIKSTDKNKDVVGQVWIQAAGWRGTYISNTLIVAASTWQLLLVASLHLYSNASFFRGRTTLYTEAGFSFP